MKTCCTCGLEKPLTEFYAHRRGPDGLATECKVCAKARAEAWRRAHGQKPRSRATHCKEGHDLRVEENRRAGRWECAVCHREKQIARHRADPETHRAKAREYGREHKAEAAERAARYRARHRLELRDESRRQHAMRGNVNRTAIEYISILRHDPCAYCGGPCEHIDHIEPLKAKGDLDWTNLTASCGHCNHSKLATPLVRFLHRRQEAAA